MGIIHSKNYSIRKKAFKQIFIQRIWKLYIQRIWKLFIQKNYSFLAQWRWSCSSSSSGLGKHISMSCHPCPDGLGHFLEKNFPSSKWPLLLCWISIRPWWTLELLTELKKLDKYYSTPSQAAITSITRQLATMYRTIAIQRVASPLNHSN